MLGGIDAVWNIGLLVDQTYLGFVRILDYHEL